jgi:cytochrome c556
MIIADWTSKVKVYMIYCYTIFWGTSGMKAEPKNEEMRWQIIKAMLDEFPTLKEKTRTYLNKRNPR